MPNRQRLLNQITKTTEDLLSSIDKENQKQLLKIITKLEIRILRDLATLDDEREIAEDVDTQTIRERNFRSAQAMHDQLLEVFNDLFAEQLIEIIQGYDRVARKIRENYKTLDLAFEFSDFDKAFMTDLKQSTYATLVNMGSFARNRVKDAIYQYVLIGDLNREELIEQIKNLLSGIVDQRGNPLSNQAGRYVQDSLMDFYATVNIRKSEDLGFDWFLYYGDIQNNSRDFCVKRAGKVFHVDEIKRWENLIWQGKSPGNIFVKRGGYRCQHHFQGVMLDWLDDDVEIIKEKIE